MTLAMLELHLIKRSMAFLLLQQKMATRVIWVDCRTFQVNVCQDVPVQVNLTLGLCTLMERMLAALRRK
jgi:hypothetical protein